MVTITLYAKQKKRHRCTEQTFRLCGRRRGWGFDRTALKQVYHQGWNRSPAQVGCTRQVLRAGALGRPGFLKHWTAPLLSFITLPEWLFNKANASIPYLHTIQNIVYNMQSSSLSCLFLQLHFSHLLMHMIIHNWIDYKSFIL